MQIQAWKNQVLKLLIILFACFNLAKWSIHLLAANYSPLDFNTYYAATFTYFKGKNPYDSSERKSVLQTFDDKTYQSLAKFSAHETPVYAPQFVWIFRPFLSLNYNFAKYLNLALNCFCLLLIPYLISRLNHSISFIWSLLSVMAFRGTWFALDNGQPLFIGLTLILGSLYLSKVKNSAHLAGLLLGLAGYKFTLLFAPLIYYFLKRQYKTLITFTLTFLALNILSIALIPQIPFAQILDSWKNNIRFIWEYGHANAEFNGLNIINCSSSVMLAYYQIIPKSSIQILYSSLLMISMFATGFWAYRNKEEQTKILLAITFISMSFSQHLIYDLLVLVAYALLLYQEKIKMPLYCWPLIITMTVPIGKLAEILHYKPINFLVPILVLMTTLIFIFRNYFSSKNKAIKNDN